MRSFTANAIRRVRLGMGGSRVVLCALLGVLVAGTVSAQPGGGQNPDSTAVTRVMGSLQPSYSTNYNVNRQTTDWLQNFDFGANFSFMNFTNKTNFDVHTDAGRDETRRNGRNKLDMRWLMVRKLPITTSFNLERTATSRPLEERQIDFADLTFSTTWSANALRARHTMTGGGGFNRRKDNSTTSDAINTTVDRGLSGNFSWRARWNFEKVTLDGSAALRRLGKTSTLNSNGVIESRPTTNISRNARVGLNYDPSAWLTTNVEFMGNFGTDQYFLTQEAQLENKINERRAVNASIKLKPRESVGFTWNLSADDRILGYKVRNNIASAGNGFSWDGTLVFQNVLGAVVEGTLRSSRDLLRPATSADTETNNNVFEGKLDRGFGPKFTFRLNWLARATQVFFRDPDPVNILDRDELKTKIQPTLTYHPGNKWTVTAAYIRSTNRQIQLNPARANQTKNDEDFTVDIAIGFTLSPRTQLSQIYSIKALYTTFDFNPFQDRLLSSQRIVTSITSQLTPRAYLGLEHRFTLQDSGPFRFDETGNRIFSRSLRRYRQELSTNLRYNFVEWVSALIDSRILKTQDLNENTGNRTERKDLNLRVGGEIKKDLGRGLSFNATGQYVRSNVQDSFWNIISSLRKDF